MVSPKSQEGAGNAGCAVHPQSRVELVTRGVVTTGSPQNTRRLLRNGFTAYFALSLVTGLICHHRPREDCLENLTPASGRQDHTTSPSAFALLVKSAIRVHRILCPTLVTMADAPLMGTGPATYASDLRKKKSEEFLPKGLDRIQLICPTGMIAHCLAPSKHPTAAINRSQELPFFADVVAAGHASGRSLP